MLKLFTKVNMDNALESRITIDPGICNGKPIIRGMRITVETILGYLSAGETIENILEQYPTLEPDDIKACLAYASSLASHKFNSAKFV